MTSSHFRLAQILGSVCKSHKIIISKVLTALYICVNNIISLAMFAFQLQFDDSGLLVQLVLIISFLSV